MPNVHPILTHFPIVFLTTGLVCDVMSVLLNKTELERAGAWGQLLGALGLAATVVSGMFARVAVEASESARNAISSHEQVAFVAAALTAFLLLWRTASRLKLPVNHKSTFLLLSLASVVALWFGAWLGGELVYRFGIGVQHLAR